MPSRKAGTGCHLNSETMMIGRKGTVTQYQERGLMSLTALAPGVQARARLPR